MYLQCKSSATSFRAVLRGTTMFRTLVLCRSHSWPFAQGTLFVLHRRAFNFLKKSAPKKEECSRQAKCVILTGFGGYNKFKVGIKDVPSPGPGQVLLGVKAGGMNFADIYVRHGLFRWADYTKPPFVMGREAAGLIEEVGKNVSNFKVGDRVACTSNTGLWTEYACVDAKDCHAIPAAMSFEDAAAFYVNYLTAYFSIFDIGNLRPCDRIFVHSLAGGVGWAATQLAKTVPGVTVMGTASTWKFDAITENGVDFPLSATDDNYMKEVMDKFPGGVDIVLDNRSGSEFHEQRKMLRPLGKIIHLGMNSALIGEHRSMIKLLRTWWALKNIDIYELIMRNQSVSGINLDNLRAQFPQRYHDGVRALNSMYTKGFLKPRIDSIWTFDEVAEASHHLTSRKSIGKILLKAH